MRRNRQGTYTFDPQRDKVKRFDSPEAYLAFVQDIPYSQRQDSDDWAGDDWSRAMKKLELGDTSLVHKAEKIIDKIHHSNLDAPGVSLIQPSVVGFMPNVPAAIIGHPESMFLRQNSDVEGYQTPLCIYVETSISAGVSHDQIMNKGIAILAFAMFMQAIRPVEIFMCSTGSADHLDWAQSAVVKLASSPLDLARACFMMTDVTYARRIGFSAVHAIANVDYVGLSGMGWAWNAAYRGPGHGSKPFETAAMQMLNLSDTDVYIGGGYLHDTLMRTNPVEWIKYMIEKHTNQGE